MEPTIKYKGGGSFVVRAPQFSPDGRTLYIARKNTILIYNVKTAKRLRELNGLKDSISGFNVYHVDGFEYVTACSRTGEIISWKVEIGFRILRSVLPLPNYHILSFNHATSTREIAEKSGKYLVTYKSNKDDEEHIFFGLFNLHDKKWQKLLAVPKDKRKYNVAVCCGQNPYFGVVMGRKLYFMRISQNLQPYIHNIEKDKYFTCIACHPEEECVLTGDNLGRIMLWYNLATKNASRAVYHWHTLPVKTLHFSYTGTNFYSGADECVLVRWYLDNPNQKEFVPRLRSTIEHIVVSNENQFIAVATSDNAIQILDSRFETVNVIQHLVLGKSFPAGITYDYRTKSMVLNGLTGHIQFYSPQDMTLLYNLDIVGQNKLTDERNSNIENTNVTKIAICITGLWLATVEERTDVSYSFELRLKFWAFNTVKQLFELNTSVELPHEKGIKDLLYQPSYNENLRCVTIGDDNKFKVWQLFNSDTVYGKSNLWSCTRVGFYRDLPCNALAFSADGSLLSIGFGPIITTWLPDTCELKCSLLYPGNRKNISTLEFGSGNQCHLLVAVTSEQLSVWNLLSLTVAWTVSIQVSLLVSALPFTQMAVFTTDQKVFIFNPGSPQPLFSQTLGKETKNVVAAVFMPNNTSRDSNLNWFPGSQLYFITSNQELCCLDTEEDTTNSLGIFNENINESLFKAMQAKYKSNALRRNKSKLHMTNNLNKNQQLKQLLEAPIHSMIPIRLTCGSFLHEMIIEHKLSKTNVT